MAIPPWRQRRPPRPAWGPPHWASKAGLLRAEEQAEGGARAAVASRASRGLPRTLDVLGLRAVPNAYWGLLYSTEFLGEPPPAAGLGPAVSAAGIAAGRGRDMSCCDLAAQPAKRPGRSCTAGDAAGNDAQQCAHGGWQSAGHTGDAQPVGVVECLQAGSRVRSVEVEGQTSEISWGAGAPCPARGSLARSLRGPHRVVGVGKRRAAAAAPAPQGVGAGLPQDSWQAGHDAKQDGCAVGWHGGACVHGGAAGRAGQAGGRQSAASCASTSSPLHWLRGAFRQLGTVFQAH